MVSPDRRPTSAARVIGSIWIAVAGVNLLLSLLGPSRGRDALTMLGTNLCGLVVALVLSSAIDRLMRHRTRPDWLALALAAASGGTMVWLADAVFQFWATHPFVLPTSDAFLPVRYNLVYFLLIFALQTAALALLSANGELARQERQLADATFAEQQARLEALQLQLNPHFLFNALNALATLAAEGRNEDAGAMIALLSDFLRTTLSTPPQETTTLADELDTAQAYLDIEAIRFGDRLNVTFDCEPELGTARVPGLILQPLVENAVKHAVGPSPCPVQIDIAARSDNEILVVSVADSGSSRTRTPSSAGVGIGLKNVSARLEALYGIHGSLVAGPSRSGFQVAIRLPLSRASVE